MAEVIVNGNVVDSTTPDHTSGDASTSEFIYINAEGNLTIDQKRELLKLGVEIQEFISDHTYMCHYKADDLEPIRALSYIRAANVYEPAMKTVSSLKADIGDVPEHTEYKIEVLIHADSPQTMDQVAEEIASRTGVPVHQMKVSPVGIELTVHQDKIAEIEGIDSVNRIEEYQEQVPTNEYARGVLAQNSDYSNFGWSQDQFRYKGRGQIVCVADTGVDGTHRHFKDKIVKNENFWEPKKDEDPNGHGTHVAGSVINGVATECKIINQNMWWAGPNGQNGMFPSPNLAYMFEQGYRDGAFIHTNSWGTPYNTSAGQLGYTQLAVVMDLVSCQAQDYLVLVAGGNDGGKNGWKGEIGGQNGAKNVITVGNCMTTRPNDGEKPNPTCMSPDGKIMHFSSSTGPTLPRAGLQGRIKPDVVAPGTMILSSLSAQTPYDSLPETEKYEGSRKLCYKTGTSMATPHVAGCAAVIREALLSPTGGNYQTNNPSGSLIKALLVNGTVDLKGHPGNDWATPMTAAPNCWQGFGRVNLSNSLFNVERKTSGTSWADASSSSGAGWSEDRPYPLGDGQVWTSKPIPFDKKVFAATLVYPDPPGELTQNNLNLTVKCGTQYQHGNLGFTDAYDTVNNVEKVVWENPPARELQIQVRAAGITRLDEKQPFAVAWMSYY